MAHGERHRAGSIIEPLTVLAKQINRPREGMAPQSLADGLATALVVMGAARGIELVNQMENVECLIITRDDGNRLIDHLSQGFRIAN